MNLRRTRAVARKEFWHILRDARSLGLALAMPMMMLLLFGYALSLDVDQIPTAVVDQDRTPQSRDLLARFAASRYFKLVDFPENLQVALDRGLPKYLQKEAAKIGPHFARLVRGVLTPHAYMNLRRAQGVMSAAKAFTPELVERAARDLSPKSVFSPKHFKAFLEKSRCIEESDKPPPAMSQETRSYLRTINYFNHQSPEGEPHVPQSSTTTDAIESLEALRHSRHP